MKEAVLTLCEFTRSEHIGSESLCNNRAATHLGKRIAREHARYGRFANDEELFDLASAWVGRKHGAEKLVFLVCLISAYRIEQEKHQ